MLLDCTSVDRRYLNNSIYKYDIAFKNLFSCFFKYNHIENKIDIIAHRKNMDLW